MTWPFPQRANPLPHPKQQLPPPPSFNPNHQPNRQPQRPKRQMTRCLRLRTIKLIDGWLTVDSLDGWLTIDPLDGWASIDPLDGWASVDPLDGWVSVKPLDGWLSVNKPWSSKFAKSEPSTDDRPSTNAWRSVIRQNLLDGQLSVKSTTGTTVNSEFANRERRCES